jgi:acetyl-CoA carboxylase carboxyl transferase subunit alpha
MPEETTALDFEMPIVQLDSRIAEIRNLGSNGSVNLNLEVKSLEEKRDHLIREIFSSLTPWQRVQLARHPKRPHTNDYIQALFADFTEMHGDRTFADDAAVIGGCAFFGDIPVMVMGHQKGRTVEESMMRNFGMMHPEGYRKALRLMKLGEKFKRPVITFIDTPGAYPGIGAEERGQARAIAVNLREMSMLKVPSISIVIGEGGSGGALGIGVADRILMLENAWYSVISPEGCAAILFRDSARAADAAKVIKLTAQDLFSLKVIDEIVPEPPGGAHRDPEAAARSLREIVSRHLSQLSEIDSSLLVRRRYDKYRQMGVWRETALEQAGGSQRKAKKIKRTKT